ncbi:MAG: hypothetical protein RIR39_399 [Pseudomonadota bacterium]
MINLGLFYLFGGRLSMPARKSKENEWFKTATAFVDNVNSHPYRVNYYCHFNIGGKMIEQFKAAMQASGITPPNLIIGDGQIHRFHIEGDKRSTQNGAYFLYLDGKANGWFSNWRGVTGKWSASGKAQPITFEMRQQIQFQRQQREEEELLRNQQAAKTATYIWNKSTSVHQHNYMIRKLVQPHGVRLYRDSLVIPIYSESRDLVNLQFITPNGDKRFLAGAKKKGCFTAIQKEDDSKDIILLCEGWATGASIYERTGNYTAIALDAGNLLSVAQTLKRLYPQGLIIVCGDNDESGVGQKAAIETAKVVNGRFVIPSIVGQDWNDYLANGGEL